MKHKLVFLLFLFFLPKIFVAQISGEIISEDSKPIPFASIYIHKTQSGQISNEAGLFSLDLPSGKYKLTFQCMGYQSLDTTITLSSEIKLKIQLQDQSFSLPEVIVSESDFEKGELIIRKAIAKAPFHRDKIISYDVESYIKGSGRIKKLPRLLNNPNDLSLLDSTMAFVLESKSKIKYTAPGNFKETLIAYKKLRGDNTVAIPYLYPDFYVENVADGLSPLAFNALNHYHYKLEKTFIDKGELVYQLKVLPKKNGPGWYSGTLFINDKDWSIYGLNLSTILNGFLLSITQNFAPVHQRAWLPITNQIEWSGNIFGASFSYLYLANLTNYEVVLQPEEYFEKFATDQPAFTDPFNKLEKKEIKRFRKEVKNPKSPISIDFSDSTALGYSTSYWDSIRPIPLSVYEARGNKFLDSLSTAQPLLNSNSTRSFEWSNLLMALQFNPVEGFHLYQQFDFRKTKNLSFSFTPRYSFADQKFRWLGQASYQFKSNKVNLELGQYIFQYGQSPPIDALINSYQNLFFDKSYIRLYHKNFVRLSLASTSLRPFQYRFSVENAYRHHLNRNTTQTWLNRTHREYDENLPDNPLFGQPNDFQNRAWLFEGLLKWQSNKYSNGPIFELLWRTGFVQKTYHLLQLSHQNTLNFPARGSLDYKIELGGFWNGANATFQDMKHFSGNTTNFFSTGPIGNFRTLGFYQKTTNESFVQMSLQYNPKKLFLSQFSFFWKNGLEESLFSSLIANQSFGYHAEFGYGISNIFRLFRFEVVTGLEPNEPLQFKWMLGLSTSLKGLSF